MKTNVQRGAIVLVDTNVIIESHRVRIWPALASYYALHTVETIVVETQTGAHNRAEQDNIDDAALRASLTHIHQVTDEERAVVYATAGGVVLDPGELDLLAYASTLSGNVWLLNSPDKAAVRYCHGRNWQDRVISLEEMTRQLNQERKWKVNYTTEWLARFKLDLFLGRL